MNIFAQLGLGSYLRACLKRAGLNLDEQFPNQELARLGSLHGTIATIDLSMASDSLAIEVVRELIPEPWFVAMDWVRSKKGTISIEGVEASFRYEKFSSMGNGFTFELESMIFYALAQACSEAVGYSDRSLCRSYGDDIAVPTAAVALLVEVLTLLGFKVNPSKSFSAGEFRESCGADFFHGVNVRPYYQKEPLIDAKSLYRLANGLRRLAFRRNNFLGCDGRLRRCWLYVANRLPSSLRGIIIPAIGLDLPWADVETGDGGLVDNLDKALSSPDVSFNRDLQYGWTYARVDALPWLTTARSWAQHYLYALYECRDGAGEKNKTTFDSVIGRGGSSQRLNFSAYCADWFDLGPWI
jgi:hypothetical protein